MKILVGCEFSAVVRDAFRDKGHDAWSCDLLPTHGEPDWHLQMDVLKAIKLKEWDMLLAFPPCTYICNSGVGWLYKHPERWLQMEDGAFFFKKLLEAPIDKICIENPIMHKHAMEIVGKTYTQIIQPWQFGHSETKATCLWLKNLPPLEPTDIMPWRMQRVHYETPSKDRWMARSKTFDGIATAMAELWG